jgi:hypothetical protein
MLYFLFFWLFDDDSDNTFVVVMCVALSEYDCVLYYDGEKNRLAASLDRWDKMMKDIEMKESLPVLIFTHQDIFRDKLRALGDHPTLIRDRLRKYPPFTNYDGDGAYEHVLSYITNLFMSRVGLVHGNRRQIMIAICNACNFDSVEYVFRHILAALRDNPLSVPIVAV